MTRHGVHSPFVFDLVTNVFPGKKGEDFSAHPAEQWRSACLQDHSLLHVTDLGTGNSGPRKISSIARHAAKKPAQGQLLHRIVRHFRPGKMLELGTSLGITTLYESSASPGARFITLEGCPETAAKAAAIFREHAPHVEIRTGEFGETLPAALQSLGAADYAFFDGNHREAPTLSYFETALPFAHNDSVFIFDDIHWSHGMELAWEKIKAHPRVTVTIDVFYCGIVFFRKEQAKEHFVLRF